MGAWAAICTIWFVSHIPTTLLVDAQAGAAGALQRRDAMPTMHAMAPPC
jgi:hypothetical protein